MKTLRKILSPLFDFIFAIKVKYNLLNKDELINLKFSILDDDYFFCELLQNTLIQAGASEDNVSTFTDEFNAVWERSFLTKSTIIIFSDIFFWLDCKFLIKILDLSLTIVPLHLLGLKGLIGVIAIFFEYKGNIGQNQVF